jgi:hypothetical protein
LQLGFFGVTARTRRAIVDDLTALVSKTFMISSATSSETSGRIKRYPFAILPQSLSSVLMRPMPVVDAIAPASSHRGPGLGASNSKHMGVPALASPPDGPFRLASLLTLQSTMRRASWSFGFDAKESELALKLVSALTTQRLNEGFLVAIRGANYTTFFREVPLHVPLDTFPTELHDDMPGSLRVNGVVVPCLLQCTISISTAFTVSVEVWLESKPGFVSLDLSRTSSSTPMYADSSQMFTVVCVSLSYRDDTIARALVSYALMERVLLHSPRTASSARLSVVSILEMQQKRVCVERLDADLIRRPPLELIDPISPYASLSGASGLGRFRLDTLQPHQHKSSDHVLDLKRNPPEIADGTLRRPFVGFDLFTLLGFFTPCSHQLPFVNWFDVAASTAPNRPTSTRDLFDSCGKQSWLAWAQDIPSSAINSANVASTVPSSTTTAAASTAAAAASVALASSPGLPVLTEVFTINQSHPEAPLLCYRLLADKDHVAESVYQSKVRIHRMLLDAARHAFGDDLFPELLPNSVFVLKGPGAAFTVVVLPVPPVSPAASTVASDAISDDVRRVKESIHALWHDYRQRLAGGHDEKQPQQAEALAALHSEPLQQLLLFECTPNQFPFAAPQSLFGVSAGNAATHVWFVFFLSFLFSCFHYCFFFFFVFFSVMKNEHDLEMSCLRREL